MEYWFLQYNHYQLLHSTINDYEAAFQAFYTKKDVIPPNGKSSAFHPLPGMSGAAMGF
jgi:hypothetical protein